MKATFWLVVALIVCWYMWGYWEHRACIAEYEATGSTHVIATDLCSDHSY